MVRKRDRDKVIKEQLYQMWSTTWKGATVFLLTYCNLLQRVWRLSAVVQGGECWPTGRSHRWHQLLASGYVTPLPPTEVLPPTMTDLTEHLCMTDRHVSVICFWTTPPYSSIPSPCWLLVRSMLPHSESQSLPLSLPLLPCLAPLPRMLLQDQKKNYKAVQSCEEGGSGGAYLEPLVALAQNGANMHNVLGPACIFLRKGFAESRQAVRKSRKHHVHACQERH